MKTAIYKSVLFIIISLFSINLDAQDIIVLKKAQEIQGKVLSVEARDVKYKKYSNLDGPTYSLPKTDIFMIKYENGEKEVFNSETSDATVRVEKAEKQNLSTVDTNNKTYSDFQKEVEKAKDKDERVIFSVRGSGNMCIFRFSDGKESDRNVGFGGSLGVQCNIPTGGFVDFIPYLGYTQANCSLGDTESGKLKAGYLNLNLGVGSHESFYYKAGFEVGLLVHSSMTYEEVKISGSDLDMFKAVRCGLYGEFGWSNEHVEAGMNFSWGLNNISKSTDTDDISLHVSWIGLSLAYKF